MDQAGPLSLVSVSVACCMDAFFVRHIQVPRVFLSCRYPVKFFGDHRSKTKFAKDFPNMICITNCKPRYSKSKLKNVFRIMGTTLLSVNAKIGSPVLLYSGIFFIPVSSLKVFGNSIHSERRRIYLGKSIQALMTPLSYHGYSVSGLSSQQCGGIPLKLFMFFFINSCSS